MISTAWHSRKGETMGTVKRSVVASGWERQGWTGGTWGIFRAVKQFCVILQWWKHAIVHLSKSIEFMTPRVNPKVNYRL